MRDRFCQSNAIVSRSAIVMIGMRSAMQSARDERNKCHLSQQPRFMWGLGSLKPGLRQLEAS